MKDLTNAIVSLRPGAEFSLWDEDLDTLVWHKLEGDAPTVKEINDEADRLAKLVATAKADAAAKKAALLERLGITEDEARLLLS